MRCPANTFASWLVMREGSLKEVYAHLSPDRLREAVTALDNLNTTSARRTATVEISLVSTRQN